MNNLNEKEINIKELITTAKEKKFEFEVRFGNFENKFFNTSLKKELFLYLQNEIKKESLNVEYDVHIRFLRNC